MARHLTIEEMQEYYDRSHGGRGTYVNRKALATWNLEIRSGEITLPSEFAGVSDGKVMTWRDVMQVRRERQKDILVTKRSCYDQVQKKPLYVWVFWCPGISGIFKGLWTYIVGIGGDYHGGGRKGELAGQLLDEVMRLFPLVDKPLFLDYQYYESWRREFVKKYTRGEHCGHPQGKAPIWAKVQGSSVLEILGRAKTKGATDGKTDSRN